MFKKNVNDMHLEHFIHTSLLITLMFRGLVNRILFLYENVMVRDYPLERLQI